ncbi:hypothetical protein Bca4012_070387 [Brassica carinata]|uniref:Uncharacterized protein n=2 Tax=Brassica TaxID=3705 RepID=A0A8X7U6H8_BRACI|nr:hypothetical protein Bca52824_062635 [Brassica carinata]CAF1925142.1 unnamed protein product [Brassica napus]
MGPDRNDPENTEACPKTSGVIMGEQSDPQPPDPRWPYLDRWSKAVTPPIMSVQQKEIGVLSLLLLLKLLTLQRNKKQGTLLLLLKPFPLLMHLHQPTLIHQFL